MAACEERIPIFPVRYTVVEKGGLDAYSYNHVDLETGYPELKHSTYTMRLLREGFVYLYDASKGDKTGLKLWKVNKEGDYTELTSLTTIPKNDAKAYKTGNRVPFISACAASTEVYVGFTDTLWTEDKYAEIVANKGSIRDSLMSKINVKQWAGTRTSDGTHKGKNTFPVEKIQENLEEYKNFKTNLAWSGRDTELGFTEPTALKNIMTNIASRGQIVVALYDNIGLVEDQGMLIHKRRKKVGIYAQEQGRKKLVAGLIEDLYKQDFAKSRKIKGGMAEVNTSLQKEINNIKTQGGHRGRGVREAVARAVENGLSAESYILSKASPLKFRHIDEAERLKFISDYDKEITRLTKRVIETKNDRYALIKSYKNTSKPTDLGSAFLNYDDKNDICQVAHSEAFASCIDGMVADVNKDKSVVNKEHKLFEEWWQSKKGDNPILDNLARDKYLTEDEKENLITRGFKDKKDTVGDVMAGAASIAIRTAQDNKSRLKAVKGKEAAAHQTASAESLNKAKQASTSADDAAKAAKGIQSKLRMQYSTTELTHNIVSYSLTRWEKWNGAVLDNIDDMFNKLLNMKSKTNAQELVKILTGQHEKITGQYSPHVSYATLTNEEYLKAFAKAANMTEEQSALLHGAGGLKTPKKVLVVTHVANSEILKAQQKASALSNKSKTASAVAAVATAEARGSDALRKSAQAIANGRQNPFVTVADNGFSALGLILNVMNLKTAVNTFYQDKNFENGFNLASATMGVASAINGSLMAVEAAMGSARFERYVVTNRVTRFMAGKLATKIFGFGAAFFDGVTQAIKSYKAFAVGNTEAGTYYAISGVLLLAGGIALTVAIGAAAMTVGVALLVVAGIAMLVGGIIFLFKGDDASYTLMDHWLKTCIFRLNKNDKGYKDETMEFERYLEARYQPTVTADWSRLGTDTVEVELYQPIKALNLSMNVIEGQVPPTFNKNDIYRGSTQTIVNRTGRDTKDLPNGAVTYTMYTRGLTDGTDYISGYFSYMPLLTSKYKHWITTRFTISKDMLYGGTVKILPAH